MGVLQTAQKCDLLIYVVDSILGLEFRLDLHCIKKFIVFVVSCNVFVEKGILWGGEQEELKRINDWW